MASASRCAVLLLGAAGAASGLNNGLAQLPEMGLNTWYAIHNHLTNYTWQPGYCASCDVLDIARWFTDNGLRALGYNRINFDDCIV